MKKTRFAALASVVVAAALLTSTGTAKADGDNVFHFGGSVGVGNPCNGEGVSGPVDATAVVNRQANGKNGHVNAHLSFHGTLTGTAGNTYQLSAVANGKSDDVNTGTYFIPYHAQVAGLGGAPNFTFDGIIRVFVNADGEPTGANFASISATCGN
jgi:hypothetical protein